MARPADEEMIGRTIAGKFHVEKFLGGGAMGAVYKAYQKSIQKHVAIKVLHKEFVVEASFVSRFEREAKAASLLDHVNLMRVIDYGREPDGVCYIAMELLEGRSLFQVLKEDGRLANERMAGLIRQTLAGLAVAHEQGIIHRDLKPENIIVLEKFDDDGKRAEIVKVCDFGMAKMVSPDAEVPSSEAPLSSEKLTSHGVVVGTPDYMSPEQGRGERLDARSDLYAVGVILYQMLAGRLPFSAETPIATLLRHVIDEPEPPSEIDPDVHPGLESICLRALAKRRDDRFQTAREMRQEIRTVIEGRGVGLPSALPPPRLTLGSLPEDSIGRLSLRAPGVPRSIDLGGPVSGMNTPLGTPALTPPNSHRIRAVEALGAPPAPSKKWPVPVALVVVAALGAGGFFAVKHRRHAAVAAPVAQASATATPAATEGTPPAVAVGASPSGSAAPESPPPAEAPADPGRAETKPTYATPAQGALIVRGGGSRPDPSASATPVASAPLPAFGLLAVPEVPKIAGSPDPATPPAPPPSSAPAPSGTAAAPGAAFDHAHVSLGPVRGEKVAGADVLAALPGSRFDRCYKKELSTRGSAVGGSGSLHLTIEASGHIDRVTFAGEAELAGVGQCIADAALGSKNIAHVEPGVTGADVDLTFRAE
jgi:serine/threonine-protein kinase